MKYLLILFILVNFNARSQNLLIKNGSFEKQLLGWNYGIKNKNKIERPNANFTIVDKFKEGESALSVRIERHEANEKPNAVYLIQNGIKLKKGKKYRVSFYVKSKIRKDKIHVAVGSGPISTNRKFIDLNLSFLGNNEWQKITYTFLAKSNNSNKQIDLKSAAVYFGFNFRNGEYLIDNVNIELIK